MSIIFDDRGHLTHEAIVALKADSISEIELMHAVSHIADCETCACTYAESFHLDELEEVPLGFAEQVLNKLDAEKKNSKQFIYYSIRVAFAACASLVILFSGILNYFTSPDITIASKPPNLAFINSINNNLKDFSQNLLDMEVILNEKAKK